MTALLFLGAHALALLSLCGTAFVAGRLALRAAQGDSERSIPARPAIAISLGLIVLATIGALLGLLGRLDRASILIACAAILLAGLALERQSATARYSPVRRRHLLVFLPVALPYFVLATYPPTAFDETLYHLPFARAFVASGALPFLPELRFPVLPQLAEVLSAELLAFGSDTATHLPSLLAVALTTALIWSWGQQWQLGDRPTVGWVAAAIWLGNPIVAYLSGTGYVEPLLTLFVTAAAYAFWLWQRDGSRGWLVLCAVFAAASAGTKYLGLYFVAAFAFAALVARPATARRSGRVPDLALFVGVAAVVLAPWYGRILAFTGNPLFPYLSGLFGENDWTPIRFRTLLQDAPRSGDWVAALARGARRIATLPWDLVARRDRVGGMPPFSPVYLLGFPLLLAYLAAGLWFRRFQRPRNPREPQLPRSRASLRVPILAATVFLALFPLLPADARYLVAVLPLFSLALAVAAVELSRLGSWSRRREVHFAAALLIALPGWLYAAHRIAKQGPPPTTPAARETFLRRALPFYPAIDYVNGRIRPGEVVYGLNLETMRYYARGEFQGDWYGPNRYDLLLKQSTDAESFRSTLESWGVDYLVVPRVSETAAMLERDGTGMERLYEDRAALVYDLRPNAGGE